MVICPDNSCPICWLCPPQPGYLPLLHYLGAAISFLCICFYTVMLTALTGKCVLSGYERFLYPLRIVSTVIQITVTICCILSLNLWNSFVWFRRKHLLLGNTHSMRYHNVSEEWNNLGSTSRKESADSHIRESISQEITNNRRQERERERGEGAFFHKHDTVQQGPFKGLQKW